MRVYSVRRGALLFAALVLAFGLAFVCTSPAFADSGSKKSATQSSAVTEQASSSKATKAAGPSASSKAQASGKAAAKQADDVAVSSEAAAVKGKAKSQDAQVEGSAVDAGAAKDVKKADSADGAKAAKSAEAKGGNADKAAGKDGALSKQAKGAEAASKPMKAAEKASEASGKGLGDIAPGDYYITSQLKSSQAVAVEKASTENKANVGIVRAIGDGSDQWRVAVNASGYATLQNLNSNLFLTLSGKAANGTNVVQKKASKSKGQQWLVKQRGAYYILQSAANRSFVLDIAYGKATNGANVIVWSRNAGKNQSFAFTPIEVKAPKKGKQKVKDGIYVIRSQHDERVAGTAGGSASSGANVAAQGDSSAAWQAFDFTYDGEGFYTITNVKSGKKLAACMAKNVPGVNVAQYAMKDADVRTKWKLVKRGKGVFVLISKGNGYRLGVEDNGNIALTSDVARGNAELFALQAKEAVPGGAVVIEVAANTKLALDVYASSTKADATVGTYAESGGYNQKFVLTKKGAGYTIRPMHSRLYLTSDQNGRLVQRRAQTGFANQVWKPEMEHGLVTFVNAANDQVLSIASVPTKAASTIKLADPASDSLKRQFYLRSVAPIVDGTYIFTALTNQGQVLSVAGARRVNGANLNMYKSNGNNCQKFNVTKLSNGNYAITNVATGRAVDVAYASTANGANVVMYTYSGAANQQWKIELNDDFSLSFTSALSGKRLDMQGGNTANGTNVRVWNYIKNGPSQRFWFRQTAKANEVVDIGVPVYMQNSVDLPTGCESVALTNALRYWGFNLGTNTIADSWMPWGSDGVYNFIGNPHNDSGWIICAPGITNTANNYLSSKGSNLRAKNITGTSLEGLRPYIDRGQPVVVWTTISMGQPTGVKAYRHGYALRGNNHAVVLSGYDPNNGRVLVSDSLAGRVWRSGSAFRSLYNLMGKQAVVIGDE